VGTYQCQHKKNLTVTAKACAHTICGVYLFVEFSFYSAGFTFICINGLYRRAYRFESYKKSLWGEKKTFPYTIRIYVLDILNIISYIGPDHLVCMRPCRQLGVKSGCGCNGFIKRMLYNSVIFLCDTYYDEKKLRWSINYPHIPIVHDRKI